MHIARFNPADQQTVPAPPFLRVLYVLGSFPVLSETFVSNEIRGMRAQGHTVIPLALAPHQGACQPQDECFRAETVLLGSLPAMRAAATASVNPARLHSALKFAREQKGLPARSLMLAGMRAAYAARRFGCSHLHAHFALPAAATAITGARLAGLTSSFIGHGYDIYGTPADLALKLRSTDVALATCQDMRRDFLALAPDARVRILHCGVDPDFFRPNPAMPRNGRILAIGRLAEQKGYDVLLAAIAAMPPPNRPFIDAVGAGDLAESLHRMTAELGISHWVRFLGARPSAWIASEGPAYLGFVAPYCLTANGDRDTGPVVVKEALAMGLPVVASALMGLKEAVTPACGRHVTPRDTAELAEALHWLNTMPEEQRQIMGAAGRRHVQADYTIAGQAAALAAAIRGISS